MVVVRVAMAGHVGAVVHGASSTFLGGDDVLDNAVCVPQLSNLLLHHVFQHILLLLDECTFLLVVFYALLVTPVAPPPLAPGELAGSTAIGTCITAFLTGGGTFGAGSEATAAVVDESEQAAAAQDT